MCLCVNVRNNELLLPLWSFPNQNFLKVAESWLSFQIFDKSSLLLLSFINILEKLDDVCNISKPSLILGTPIQPSSLPAPIQESRA